MCRVDPMRKKLLLLILGLLGAVAAPAAPLERDLGQGLTYFRVHVLPEDLPVVGSVRGQAVILDVRYVPGDARLGAGLALWLRAHANPRSPVFLLANSATSPALLSPFSAADSIAGLVILGPASPDFAADVSLPVSAADDRRAYEALERGVSVKALLSDAPDKVRNDEARLDKDHLSDADEPPTDTDRPADHRPPQLIDAVLQRAVQLHRGLLALKRL
jgi:hypothetical protein